MRHILHLISILALSWACSGTSPDDSGGNPDTDLETGETDETGTTEEPHASLEGRMVDLEGQPLEGLQIRVCMDSCVTTGTDTDGVFEFSTLDVGTHTIQAVSFSDELHSTPQAILTLADGEERGLDDWVLPGFQTWEVLTTRTTVNLDGGLVVEADPTGMSIGPYSPSSEPIIASVRVDPSTSGLPLDELAGTVAATWYLGNYDLQMEPAWSLSGTDSLELESGSYGIWTSDNATKSWRSEGTLQIDDDGEAILTKGGLSQLTTLVLIHEEDP